MLVVIGWHDGFGEILRYMHGAENNWYKKTNCVRLRVRAYRHVHHAEESKEAVVTSGSGSSLLDEFDL